MQFEWDEVKNAANTKKHDLGFQNAEIVFNGLYVSKPGTAKDGEQRWLAVGILGARYVTVVYTWRGDVVRVISVRRSRDGEKREYRKLLL